MGSFNEQGEALGESESSVMLPKEMQGFHRRRGTQGRLALSRKSCRLPPKDAFNDTMYMVGGWSPDEPSCLVEQFCPQYNEWRMMAPMVAQRGDVGVCTLGGWVYAAGGHDGVSCFSSVERYDPRTNSWSNDVAPLTCPRSGVCLLEVEGFLWAIGGFDGTTATSIVERYDPKMNVWKRQAPMLGRRARAAAAVLNGNLYVIGGTDGDTPLRSVECYNPREGSWSACPPMLSPREGAGCVVLQGQLYVAGGRDHLRLELSAAEKFDPDTTRWTPLKRMSSKRNTASLLMFNGVLLAVGGSDDITTLRTIEMYNHETNTWRHFGSMKTKHTGGRAVALAMAEGYRL